MPFLRFKRWQYLRPLAPHVAACTSGNRYLWKGDNQGATLVEQQKDVDELLNPMGDRQSDYEVAWERYGVTFDARGKEVPSSGIHSVPAAAGAIKDTPTSKPSQRKK